MMSLDNEERGAENEYPEKTGTIKLPDANVGPGDVRRAIGWESEGRKTMPGREMSKDFVRDIWLRAYQSALEGGKDVSVSVMAADRAVDHLTQKFGPMY